jgi:chaperonin GroES
MSVPYKPVADRVIVKPETAEQTTKSGIVLPDTAQEKPLSGVVVAVGPGKRSDQGALIPMTVTEGDVVLYAKYGGTEVKVNGSEYLIIRESDILAVKKS